jgi:hypothetical protein
MPDHDDLIAELRGLGEHLTLPEPADQRAAVRARLTGHAVPGRRRWRLWVVGGVAAVVAATGAVAPARAGVVAAVGGLLRVAGIEVRSEPAPTASLPASPLPAERSVALAEARARALFPVKVPAALGPPEDVELADPDPAGAPRVVTLTYRGGRVRFDQFDGALSVVYLKTAPDAQWVTIGAATGLWLPTAHPVTYVDRAGAERTVTARRAGPTLIWQSAEVSYRLEGLATLDEALAAAGSIG